MLLQFVLLLFVSLLKSGGALTDGEDVTDNIAPYRVSINGINKNGKTKLAEGAIISENKVVTSTFDMKNYTTEEIFIIAGDNSTSLSGEEEETPMNDGDGDNDAAGFEIYQKYLTCILGNALFAVLPINQYAGPISSFIGNVGSSSAILYSCEGILNESPPVGKQRAKAASIIFHEDYNATSFKNDIAVIHLADKFRFSDTVQPIALATTPRQAGDKCLVVSGGAVNKTGILPDHLQMLSAKVETLEACNFRYSRSPKLIPIVESQTCVGYEVDGQGVCYYDTGAPLVNNNELIGVVSFGILCGYRGPDVYTNVTYFVDWINSH